MHSSKQNTHVCTICCLQKDNAYQRYQRVLLTQDQVRRLLQEGKDRAHPWYPIWVLAAHTGCRNGELYSLRREDCALVTTEIAELQLSKAKHERNYGTINIERSWNPREKAFRSTKGKTWRTVPVSGELYWFLQSLKANNFGSDQFGEFLLPRVPCWPGYQAEVLRQFCKEIEIPSICFHALRACFATHLLQLGVSSIKVMKIGGWRDLKTMERYTRLAGVDVFGATEALEIIPTDSGVMEKVVNLYSYKQNEARQE
jgi:integrase